VNEVCDDIFNLINPNTVVTWKNGRIDNSEDASGDNSENKIKYIPQNFLNNQIELKPDSYSNKLIKSILKSDVNYRDIFSRITNHTTQFETDIHGKITDLFEIKNDLNDLKETQKELGSPIAIETQITMLTEQYESFQVEGDVLNKDKELQEVLIKVLDHFKTILTSIESDKLMLDNFLNYLKHEKTFLETDVIQNLSNKTKDEINSAIFIADAIYRDSLVNFVIEKIENKKQAIGIIRRIITSKTEQLKTLNDRLNSSDQAKETFDKLEEEKRRLSLIKNNLDQIEKAEKDYECILREIFDIYNSFIEEFEREKNSFSFDSEEYNNFEAELLFKANEFNNSLKNSLNNQKFSAFNREYGIDLFNFKYDDNFQKDLEEIIKAVLTEVLITKSGKTKKDVIKELLGVYHFINFNIIEDGDKLENMSPGKRSFALLKVLIESDKSKWPILIDQPEDDLDANSISKSLSKFLREKKKHRQIIIVSHNPNLVVGADSEQVIVANQDGSDSKNKSKRFEYISGSIENIYDNKTESCYLYCKGIKDHICDILEGGEDSFKKRQRKYNIE
jgi:hypothetical protein